MITRIQVVMTVDHDDTLGRQELAGRVQTALEGLTIMRGTPNLADKRDSANDKVIYTGAAILDEVEGIGFI